MKNKVKKGSITNHVHEMERATVRKHLRFSAEQKKIAERKIIRSRIRNRRRTIPRSESPSAKKGKE